MALFPPTKKKISSQSFISKNGDITNLSFKKLKSKINLAPSQTKKFETSSKQIMNISEFLDRKRKLTPQKRKKSNLKHISQKVFKNQNKKAHTRKSQNRKTIYQQKKHKTQKKRIEIIRSPPIKKKLINWLTKESSSGKWLRQATSPFQQMNPNFASLQKPNPFTHSTQTVFMGSPKSQISLKHSLKATIKTPYGTPNLKPRILSKTRSPISHYQLSVSPKPGKSSNSKLAISKFKQKISAKKYYQNYLHDSAFQEKQEKPFEGLSHFRSCQNHQEIRFTREDSVDYSSKKIVREKSMFFIFLISKKTDQIYL